MSQAKRSHWPRIRKILISLVLVCLAGAVMILVARMPAPTDDVRQREPVPLNVEVVRIDSITKMPDVLELPGALEPSRIVELPVEQRGTILERLVEEGDRVSEGQLLMRLDDELLQAELERARAQADFDEKMYNRSTELLERGVMNKSEVDELEARRVVSRAALRVATTNLDHTLIRAPADGILNQWLREEGEYVAPGDTVAEIVDIAQVKLVLQIPERDIQFLRVGQTIQVAVDALEGRLFSGKVTYISKIADEATRTTRVEVTLDNSQEILRAGMITRARIVRRNLRDVIMIPLQAVIPLEEGRVVYVAEEGKAHQRQVELGIIRGTRVQVLNGLSPGDLLIVKGHRQVGPGQLVEPLPAE